MYCEKCGKMIDDDAQFCTFCGEKVVSIETNGLKGGEKKKNIIKYLPIILGVAFILIIVFVAVCSYKPKIDITDYLEVDFSGYDGYGYASSTFLDDQFVKDNKDKFKLSKELLKSIDDSEYSTLSKYSLTFWGIDVDNPDEDTAIRLFMLWFLDYGSLDISNNLSNGDVVKYDWNLTKYYDESQFEAICDMFGVRIKCDDIDYVVNGLETVPEFNPFDDVTVEFTGISPYGEAIINYQDSYGIVYSIKNTSSIKNGDTVTVFASLKNSSIDNYVSTYGRIPSIMEKDYVVSGLPEYVNDYNSFSDEIISNYDDAGRNILKAEVAGWSTEKLNDMCLLGCYFSVADSNLANYANILTYVYRVTVTASPNESGINADNIYYWYCSFFDFVCYDNDVIEGNKTIYVVPSKSDKLSRKVRISLEDTKSYSYYGYNSFDNVYDDYISVFASNYATQYYAKESSDYELLSSTEQITDSFIVDAANYIANLYKTKANSWVSYEHLDDIAYSGYYFAKNNSSDDNVLIMLFLVSCHEEIYDTNTKSKITNSYSYYFTTRWTNLYISDGNVIYEKYNNGISPSFKRKVQTGKYSYDYSRLSYYGYEDFDTAYNSEILPLLNEYEVSAVLTNQ